MRAREQARERERERAGEELTITDARGQCIVHVLQCCGRQDRVRPQASQEVADSRQWCGLQGAKEIREQIVGDLDTRTIRSIRTGGQ